MLKDKKMNTISTSSGLYTKVTCSEDSAIAEKVHSYRAWLANDAVRNRVANSAAMMDEYQHMVAMSSIIVNEQEIVTFAPFRQQLSAFQTTTPKQRLFLWVVFALYILTLAFYSVTGLIVITAVTTTFYLVDLLICFLVSMSIFNQSAEEQIDEAIIHALAQADWPMYTILCPLYREAVVVPQFVNAMKALDYPREKLQILFLTEEDDATTREAIKALRLPAHFEILTVPDGQPRTKPRACNYGLCRTRGSYVVIFDAEDIPDPLQLKKAVLAFANSGPNTACVQAKLNFYNAQQNMLTRWFTAEYSSWFGTTLPGLQMLNVPLPLGGTSNHFRTDILRTVGAWDPFNVTEDCDLGLRLGHHGMKTVVLDSITLEEANSQYKNWMRQRSRWIKGYMQTYLVYMRNPLDYLRKGQIRHFLSLQFIIGGKTAILLINPLMWILLLIYIIFHTWVNNAYRNLYPTPVLYMAAFCLIFGNILYIYTHLIGCMKQRHYSLVKSTLLIPIYWAMASGAAYIALYQLIIKPHYWEKTLHGLFLLKQTAQSITQELLSISSIKTQQIKTRTQELIAISNQKTQKIKTPTQEHISISSQKTREMQSLSPKGVVTHPEQTQTLRPFLQETSAADNLQNENKSNNPLFRRIKLTDE